MPDKKNDHIQYIQDRVESVANSVSNIDKDMALQRQALEDHTRSDEKMYEELRRMNDILQENTESLKEHVRRTNLLEDVMERMDKRLEPIEIEHIQKTAVREWISSNAKFYGKIAIAISAVAGLWVYIKPLLEHLLK